MCLLYAPRRRLAALWLGGVGLVAAFALALQSAEPVTITEFLASNSSGLQDEDGAYSDWVELLNTSASPVSLDGWFLTDDAANLTKWRFPATNLAPNSFLIVFASGKNRAVPGLPLHASFALGAGGEYLALVKADGVTVASEFAPEFPPQSGNISYGLSQELQVTRLISNAAPVRFYIPSNSTLGLTWTTTNFNDAAWRRGTNGVGYETYVPGFAVKCIRASGSVCDLATADAVLGDPSLQAAVFTETRDVVNYFNTGGEGHFANNNTFPGLTINVDVEYYVVEALGIITIPTNGNYTFGVNSDDGFRMNIGSSSFEYAAPRGPGDTFASFTLAAGDHPVRLVFYECGGGSEVELFAAPGSLGGWDASFRLVGDIANGGLAVKSLPTGSAGTSGLRPLIATDVESSMLNRSGSAYIRMPFVVTNPAVFTTLTLKVKYDDGFVAYLNGTEVARRNAPATPQWNSIATASRPTVSALIYESIDLTSWLSLLRGGTNMLAFQGLNDALSGTDFLLLAELVENKPLGLTNHYFATPTPGDFNSSEYLAYVADLNFSPNRGWYQNTNLYVSITTATPGAIIRYTTNGSAPSLINGVVYTEPILVNRTLAVRALGYREGYEPTEVETHSYLFLDQVQNQSTNQNYVGGSSGDYTLNTNVTRNPPYRDTFQDDLLSIPTLSLTLAWEDLFGPSGLWSNPGGYGVAWERPCAAEYMRPDGAKGFHLNCGVRLQGGASRDLMSKHGLRLLFKSVYGPSKLDYDLYPDSPVREFDTLTLHAAFNDQWLWGGTAATMHRDPWCRDTQNAMGGYGPHGTYVHLYLNGLYWGLYNIGEKGDASYAAHYLGGDKDEYDALNSDELIDGNLTAWSAMFAVAGAGITNDVAYTNLAQHLDIPNFIDYMLMNFYAANTDWPGHNWNAARRRLAGATWHFFSWDAEWTLGMGSDVNTDRTGDTNGSPGLLYGQLRVHPEFRRQFGDHAQKLLFNGGALSPAAAEARWAKRAAEIDRAVVGEAARWGGGTYTRETWLTAESAVRAWFPQRPAILLAQLRAAGLYPQLNAPGFSQFGGLVPPGYGLSLSNLNASGSVYYTLDGTDPRQWGGGLAPSARLYAGTLTLTNAVFVRARVRDGTSWSALVEAVFYVVQDFSGLAVTELMYHPPMFGATNSDELEFIELKNTGPGLLDLSGLEFTDGVSFVFTNGTGLAPGGFFVLGRNAAALTAKYPGLVVNGLYTGKLSDNGEKLTLAHPLGTNVSSFSYSTTPPWPITPSGLGFSLVPAGPGGDPNVASSWRASTNPGGSPGADDPAPSVPAVVINELLTHTVSPQMDTIELFNPTAASADIGGWFLSDDPAQPMKFRIPDGTTLPAGGFAVFTETNFNSTPGVPPSFALSSWGEALYLFSGNASSNLTGYSHSLEFGPAANGVSFGRYLISTGEEQWPAQSALTLGANNAGPLVGPVVINEIMYHPAPGYDEFVELYNLSQAAVALFDPAFPTNAWKLGGLAYVFPTNVTLSAGGYLLLVPIAPETFRAKYGVAGEVQILGPYSGVLQDSGERLRLERPEVPDTNGVAYITVDEVRYNDKAPWPRGADGDGPSLQRRAPGSYGNEPINWFASGITPGATNVFNQAPDCVLLTPTNGASFTAPAAVVLSALVSDPDGTILRVEYYDGEIKVGEATVPPYSYLWSGVPVGAHTVVAKARDNGLAVTPSAPATLTVAPPPLGDGLGLKAEIYDNLDFTGVKVTRTNATVNFDWGLGSPDPAIGPDTFSVRWSGSVQPRFSETYTFYTVTDDGVRLWVNNQLLINNWTDHGATEDVGVIALQGGTYYEIKMEMYENGGGATARLLWSSPSVAKEIIPQTQLYPYQSLLPLITVPPASQTVGVGSNALFSVVAVNNPTSYQWLWHGSPIPGAVGASLLLTNVQYTNAGPFQVVIANALGSITSAPAYLSVVDPPVITQQPQGLRADVGASVSFTVSVEGTLPFTFQWRLRGTNLPGATAQTLQLDYLQLNQAGPYSVLVRNAGGSVLSSAAWLSLNTPCTIVDQPQNVTLIPNPATNTMTTSNVVFSVSAVGLGPLSYHWTFWGTNLPGATNASLVVSNVALADAGPYAVTVSDTFTTITSSNALLRLLVKPTIVVPILAQSVVYGGTATFSVRAEPVHPTLPQTNRWLRGGAYFLTNNEPTLIVSNATSSATYQVVVANAGGTAFKPSVVLTVLADADQDGLPDVWMSNYFGHATGLASDQSRAQDDPDGDGASNLAEYQAGTNPTNAGSCLRLVFPPDPIADGAARFYFAAVSNKTYSVEYQNELPGSAWSNLFSLDSLPTNRLLWVTNQPPPGLLHRYYRARTPRNP